MRLSRLLILIACLLSLAGGAWAETRVGVLYPESNAAFRKLYQTIVDGMARAADVRIQVREVSTQDSSTEIKSWLSSSDSQVAVVLGELPSGLVGTFGNGMPVVYGAGALNDNTSPGVSLASSPHRMLSRLRLIKPDTERVFVVYRPQATGWLVAIARNAAREQGLELVAVASDDVHQSGAAFSRILQQARPGRDAIWLTLDPVVPLNQLLPVLLREAWEKHLVLFSNNPLDVAKGALFALYPDYGAMGKQIAERAKRQAVRQSLSGPEPSEGLNAALNTRTASHLGISLSDAQRQAFERLFPEEPR